MCHNGLDHTPSPEHHQEHRHLVTCFARIAQSEQPVVHCCCLLRRSIAMTERIPSVVGTPWPNRKDWAKFRQRLADLKPGEYIRVDYLEFVRTVRHQVRRYVRDHADGGLECRREEVHYRIERIDPEMEYLLS